MKKELKLSYEELDHWNKLSDSDQILVQKATDVMSNAYAPYSKFKVGAAVLLSNGTIVTGSNQENIAYPSGLCAERVALFYAGANYPNENVDTLCIVAKGDLVPVETILSPCGGCRQVMAETEIRQGKAYRVILVCQNDVAIVFNSALDFLPLAFGA
ncbi:MAG: cytidine deaminase [Crocinitomicaceae bacterium]|nr:cytidine deaminase [Crocinitomicaceae bacterium]